MRMSEDKVCRKDLCWFVRIIYALYKLPDVSGPGLEEAGRYNLDPIPKLFPRDQLKMTMGLAGISDLVKPAIFEQEREKPNHTCSWQT